MLSRLIRLIRKLSVKQQLILLFLIMISPIFFLNIFGNLKAEQILKRHVTNAYVELNKQNFTIINRDIDTVNKITTTVIQNPLIQQMNMTGSDTILERVKRYETIEKLLVSYSQGLNVVMASITPFIYTIRMIITFLLPIFHRLRRREFISFLKSKSLTGLRRLFRRKDAAR